jgi:hypothetical protein
MSYQQDGFDVALDVSLGLTSKPTPGGVKYEWKTISVVHQNAEGNSYARHYYGGNKRFLIEVKTYNPKNSSLNYLGYRDAISKIKLDMKRAKALNSDAEVVAVLATDYDAWINFYNTSPEKAQMLYDELKNANGVLMLYPNLYNGANNQLQKMRRVIRQALNVNY